MHLLIKKCLNRTIKTNQNLLIYWDSEYRGEEVEKRWLFDNEVIYIKDSEDREVAVKITNLNDSELIDSFRTRFIKLKNLFIEDGKLEEELNLQNNELKYKILYNSTKKLTKIKDNIFKRKVVDIEQKGELNTVLEVFERINTKNTKLSIFGIMVAKTYKKNKGEFYE